MTDSKQAQNEEHARGMERLAEAPISSFDIGTAIADLPDDWRAKVQAVMDASQQEIEVYREESRKTECARKRHENATTLHKGMLVLRGNAVKARAEAETNLTIDGLRPSSSEAIQKWKKVIRACDDFLPQNKAQLALIRKQVSVTHADCEAVEKNLRPHMVQARHILEERLKEAFADELLACCAQENPETFAEALERYPTHEQLTHHVLGLLKDTAPKPHPRYLSKQPHVFPSIVKATKKMPTEELAREMQNAFAPKVDAGESPKRRTVAQLLSLEQRWEKKYLRSCGRAPSLENTVNSIWAAAIQPYVKHVDAKGRLAEHPAFPNIFSIMQEMLGESRIVQHMELQAGEPEKACAAPATDVKPSEQVTIGWQEWAERKAQSEVSARGV